MDERYNQLARSAANFVALSPLTFLARAALVYPHHPAVIHGKTRRTWSEVAVRSRRLAAALQRHGVGVGDTVAVIAPNIPEMYEAHFGVPMAGAVLSAINSRLDARTIRFILSHGKAKVLLVDTELAPVVRKALKDLNPKPMVVDICDMEGPSGRGHRSRSR